jgi:hypothetical protein
MSIPHNHKISADYGDFLADLQNSLSEFIARSKDESAKRSIFKTCTAGHTSFLAFGATNELLKASAGVIRRICMLACIRQYGLARVEMRRLVECVIWYVYFVDHPVEFAAFRGNPSRGWSERDDRPITASACAPISSFFRYAAERMETEPSGLGRASAQALHGQYGNLSASVHAGFGAVHPSGSLAMPFDTHVGSDVEALASDVNLIVADSACLVGATSPRLLALLDGIDRGWFDWLVGAGRAKTIRGTPFGLGRDP